ncbi:family 43 glycosylhydrolase [Paludibacter sp.]|uniref:family 43 glycosylhydrolase n=1 Tax=Paludibacter sp. TaxID=1898105 RepID=UPI0013521F57|nr:family 43 glycosylhydrolase [Paludibacter sp.]MTK53237.1 family 43 glycosylhydrolase [Paludibacter sp.]
MKNKNLKSLLLLVWLVAFTSHVSAWVGSPMPRLHVDGRYLKDTHGNIVNLHGFAQTYSPWFNEQGKIWTNYDVSGCLKYNQGLIDNMLKAGWKMNFIRLHMDPYWSNTPGAAVTGENDISAFSFDRFKTALDNVFIPMAEYAISKGLYVIMRPPGVCPEKIAVGDAYNQYLIKVWGYVAQHPKLKNNSNVMFELANEPVTIQGTDGTYGAGSQGHFDNLKKYFQAVVDTIRSSADNILWVPGLGYQALYQGFAVNPIEGKNIGYAVHMYPGWFNSGQGYADFQKGWDTQVKPAANIAPIVVTEMDWAPAKYNSSWGKDSTGTAGGNGFGANFKKITDDSGNVSWLLFTGPDLLAKFDSTHVAAPKDTVFLNDPQACPWSCFHWYQQYALNNCPRPDFTYLSNSDNGDGTFKNPVIFGDFPDPDVIRVGDVYYMSTTTMHQFPGATILKSYDLVNWEYCSNPLDKIESTNCYNLDGCNRYSRGQWASSLKYHKGTYYLHFNTLDEGSYLLTATNPAGPWTKKKLSSSFYDAGLFFDDDDKIYIVYGIGKLHIAQLDADFNVVKDQAITFGNIPSGIDNAATEGSHLYKINGYYYIYSTTGGYYATQVAFRSSSIFGPYDEKEVFNSSRIHQGALIQTQTGEWWTMLFADKGAYGRLPNLEPVTWVDNWPMVGVSGKDVTSYKKPNVGRSYAVTNLPTNDNFRDYKLASQWEWNHNPDNSKWSLVKRPGFLRLYAANVADSLPKAKNTLTQRILGFPANQNLSYGTVKLHTANMAEGDVAGLCVFQDPYAFLGVKMVSGQKRLLFLNSGTKTQQLGAAVNDSVIYLRTVANYATSQADFYYSTDNKTYTQVGSLIMQYNLSVFVGNRFGIFNYSTVATGGYVDVDWFSTEKDFTEDAFFDKSFVGYSEDALTLSDLKTDATDITMVTGTNKSFVITAVYKDGHTEDVTLSATYANSSPSTLSIKNGLLIATANGDATVTVTYQGGMGSAKSLTLNVRSTYFPLTADLFNPSIYATGTFNATTHTFVPGQWGFGGWSYNNGIDLSGYKYLVVQLGAVPPGGTVVRAFDENSYWTKPTEASFDSNNRAVINLSNSTKSGTTTAFTSSHVYIVGLWANGGSPININDVYVTNNSDFSKPSANDPVITISSNNNAGGKVSGGGIYSNGSSCTLTATPATGYAFSGWTEGGVLVSSNASYTFTVSGSRTLVAGFCPGNSNCKLKVSNCTCRDSNDGALDITFTLPFSYSLNIKGTSYSKTATATSGYSLSGLAPGTYTVEITSADISGYKQNFTIVVSQPQDLNVMKVKASEGVAQYSLNGGKNYYITVNDNTVTTQSQMANIPLQKGENRISIRTDKDCQGIYQETIYFDGNNQATVFPNPTDGPLLIGVPGKDEAVKVEIATMNGSIQFQQTVAVASDRLIRLNVAGLPAGIYILHIKGTQIHDTMRLMKK